MDPSQRKHDNRWKTNYETAPCLDWYVRQVLSLESMLGVYGESFNCIRQNRLIGCCKGWVVLTTDLEDWGAGTFSRGIPTILANLR